MQINKDNVDFLSDQDLFKACKLYNINAGPVTATTRGVYLKRLKNAIAASGSGELANLNQSASNTTINKSTPTKKIETLESSVFKARSSDKDKENREAESENQNNFEISISSLTGNNEPVVKVTQTQNGTNKIIIEKTTTTITTGPEPEQPKITRALNDRPVLNTRTSTASDYDEFIRLPTVTSKLPDPVTSSSSSTSSQSYVPSSRIAQSLNTYQTQQQPQQQPAYNLVRNPITVSQSPTQKRDKFAERLENYGLLNNKEEDKVVTITSRTTIPTATTTRVPLVSPTNIRSRAPLHGFTSYTSKPSAAEYQPSKTSDSNVPTKTASSSSINWPKIAVVFVCTIVFYYIFISFIQKNPENPIEEMSA